MIGLTAIYRVVQLYFTRKKNALILCLFLLPSVLFWSSGVLKESILFLGIGLLLYATDNLLLKKKGVLHLALVFVTLFLLLYVKFYVLIVLSPVFIAWFINRYWKIKKVPVSYLALILLGSLALFNSEKINPQYNFKKILVRKQQDFKGLADHMKSGSQFELSSLEQNFTSIISAVPEALLNCFIRPIPSKNGSIFQWSAIAENLFILLLIFLAVAGRLKNRGVPQESKNLFWLGITFSILLFTIIGLTTPVAGALVRYKVPALPFLSMSLLLLVDFDGIIKRIPILKILQ